MEEGFHRLEEEKVSLYRECMEIGVAVAMLMKSQAWKFMVTGIEFLLFHGIPSPSLQGIIKSIPLTNCCVNFLNITPHRHTC